MAPRLNPLFAQMGTTIFTVMSDAARRFDAINLGQGFPDEPAGPEVVKRAAAEATIAGPNQYPPSPGLPVLRQAAAAHEQRFHGVSLDWATEVLVTSGATEAIAASILALTCPGDEVVVIQPAYDAYTPLVRMAGATPRFLNLEPPGWRLTARALRAVSTPNTRALILNDPHNPITRVLEADERDALAAWAVAQDAVIISDSVWEHLVFDGHHFVPVTADPRVAGRAVKISSVGKALSLTGWKIGYVTGAAELVRVIAKAHQYLTFTTPPNLQAAAAVGLALPEAFFADQCAALQASRDRLERGLRQIGLSVIESQSTYFTVIDLAASGLALDDTTFSFRAVEEARVASIPISVFYADQATAPRHLVRLCFSKHDATLDEALRRLAGFVATLRTEGHGASARSAMGA